MLISKDVIGYLSVLICLMQYIPLIYLTLIGRKKPHFVTRLIWALTFGITCAAQYIDNGGAGSWSNGFSALCCFIISAAALRHGNAYITRSDWVALIGALLAIPAWLLTHNPLYAALWATIIDLIGYYPTFRKSWNKPHEEMISSFTLGCLKQFLSLFAMENYSLTTLVYPIAILATDFALIFMLWWRRFKVSPPPPVTSQ